MAFTVTDFADLTRLLAERPEWQAELRRLILSEDLLALPAIEGELADTLRILLPPLHLSSQAHLFSCSSAPLPLWLFATLLNHGDSRAGGAAAVPPA